MHARRLGMTVHMHCGCTSDRGPGGDEHPYFSAEDVLTAVPSIASHANTFASLSDNDIDMLCSSGGPRSSRLCRPAAPSRCCEWWRTG